MDQMLDKNVIDQTTGQVMEVEEKKTRKRVAIGEKTISFLYSVGDSIEIKAHTTSAFSLKAAWKEYVSKNPNLKDPVFYNAFIGEVKQCPDKLRNPTKSELLKLAGLE